MSRSQLDAKRQAVIPSFPELYKLMTTRDTERLRLINSDTLTDMDHQLLTRCETCARFVRILHNYLSIAGNQPNVPRYQAIYLENHAQTNDRRWKLCHEFMLFLNRQFKKGAWYDPSVAAKVRIPQDIATAYLAQRGLAATHAPADDPRQIRIQLLRCLHEAPRSLVADDDLPPTLSDFLAHCMTLFRRNADYFTITSLILMRGEERSVVGTPTEYEAPISGAGGDTLLGAVHEYVCPPHLPDLDPGWYPNATGSVGTFPPGQRFFSRTAAETTALVGRVRSLLTDVKIEPTRHITPSSRQAEQARAEKELDDKADSARGDLAGPGRGASQPRPASTAVDVGSRPHPPRAP
ncbi:hypothetical protein LTR53_006190 [Teratosphaeriaceae sp. CCFEE 6253]|nr:hypothetical protein LTR53_006190 [Teratosphaeriaceae sp. CCFEE 6253]